MFYVVNPPRLRPPLYEQGGGEAGVMGDRPIQGGEAAG